MGLPAPLGVDSLTVAPPACSYRTYQFARYVLVDQILARENSRFHTELGLSPDGLIEQMTTVFTDFPDI